jgi:hypothetical protein
MKKRTKPKQAGSPSSLDRWQAELEAILKMVQIQGGHDLKRGATRCPMCKIEERLYALLTSIKHAERR